MEFDPFSQEFFEDPFPIYRWMRDEAPVYHNEEIGFYAVSRYDDCVEVHRDVAGFTSTHGLTLDQLTSDDFQAITSSINSMIMLDPPMHDRLRKLVNRAFTPRRISEWEPVVQRVIGEVLDRLDGRDDFDVVTDFAGPFPVEVICSIVGIPEADRQQIRHWTDRTLERNVGSAFPTEAGITAAIESAAYLGALIADKREHPSDDMIGHLIEAEIEREDGTVDHLSDGEICAFVGLLTAAGSETVTKLVGNAALIFDANRDELATMQADPSKTPGAVEEVLRYRAPSQYQGRFCVEDRTFHGVTVPAGSPMLIVTGRRQPRSPGLRGPGPLRHRAHRPPGHRLRPRHPLLHRRPPGPPRRARRLRRAVPALAEPGGRRRCGGMGADVERGRSRPGTRQRHTGRLEPPSRSDPAPIHGGSTMELTPGTRLASATCDAQVVVVRAPTGGADIDLRCGGEPMRPVDEAGEQLPISAEGEPTLMGKRYADDDLGIELLCTKPGDGALSIGDQPLLVKGAKPLPASD